MLDFRYSLYIFTLGSLFTLSVVATAQLISIMAAIVVTLMFLAGAAAGTFVYRSVKQPIL